MSAAPLPPLGWAVTLRAARSPPAELSPLPTVCCHSEVKEVVSIVNGTVLTTRTASCLPARQLLPLLQGQHIGRACLSLCCPLPAAGTACSARAGLPCSCKKPLAFCTPWWVCGGWFLHLCRPCTCASPLTTALRISSCNRFPVRSMRQGRSGCVFCWGQKEYRMTGPLLPPSFSCNKAFPGKARGVFSWAAQSTRGPIKPATLVIMWVSLKLPHDT